MDKKEYDALVAELGKQAADQIKSHAEKIEKDLNEKWELKTKGMITEVQFEEFKKSVKETELKEINDKLAEAEKTSTEQGKLLNEIKENGAGGKKERKELKTFFEEKMTEIIKMRTEAKGDFMTITTDTLKDAGVTSISGSIEDMDTPIGSPYAPGIGGPELQLFDVARNPNFILNHVDLGNTTQFRLAWINELETIEGTPGTAIAESGLKPLTQHKFKVEFSTAKKAAAYIELTEEFDADAPGLATAVRRMLQDDVLRAWDDQIQTDVIAAARPYEITELDGIVNDANLWSSLRAMMGQVGHYNFMTNTIAFNPLTGVMVDEQKNSNGTYLLPPFMDKIKGMIVEANKVVFGNALVGDLKQYKVDVYKQMTIKVGWINDDFIRNRFGVLAELRYHSYISDNRKKALCYDDIDDVKVQINGTGSF